MGIKTKKKKKFRKWQKNSGAIFEKEGVNMGWWDIVKNQFGSFDLKGLNFPRLAKLLQFYDMLEEEMVQREDVKDYPDVDFNTDEVMAADVIGLIEDNFMDGSGSVSLSLAVALNLFSRIKIYGGENFEMLWKEYNEETIKYFLLGFLGRAEKAGVVDIRGKLKTAVDDFSRDV